MLFVLGAGYFCPEQSLSDKFLLELGVAAASGCPVNLRRPTTLNLELLRTNKNSDLQQALETAVPSCTDMGEQAARQAIARAQITVEQIGLVIADCATPIEVTPAEAQRVAGRLGLKVPAYDIYTTTGVCPAHLAILSTWKKERLPAYILCVSTNAPTQRIDYSKGSDGWFYADGASACVVSAQDTRGLELLWDNFQVDASLDSAFDLDTLGYLARRESNAEIVGAQARRIFGSISAHTLVGPHLKGTKFFWSTGDSKLQNQLLDEQGIAAEHVINSQALHGDMLGSSSFFCLAEHWESFIDGQYVGMILADGALNSGGAVFRMRKGA